MKKGQTSLVNPRIWFGAETSTHIGLSASRRHRHRVLGGVPSDPGRCPAVGGPRDRRSGASFACGMSASRARPDLDRRPSGRQYVTPPSSQEHRFGVVRGLREDDTGSLYRVERNPKTPRQIQVRGLGSRWGFRLAGRAIVTEDKTARSDDRLRICSRTRGVAP
jgi:hypothetical protein